MRTGTVLVVLALAVMGAGWAMFASAYAAKPAPVTADKSATAAPPSDTEPGTPYQHLMAPIK